MKGFGAKTVCDSAVVSALSVILVLIGNYVPVVNMFAVFICGLPLTYLMIKHGFKTAAVSFAVSIILLFIITGNIIGTITTACLVLLPGTAAGLMMSKDRGYYSTLFAVIAAVLFGALVYIMLLNFFAGGENSITAMLDETINTTKNMLQPVIQEAEVSGVTNMGEMIDSILTQTKTMMLSYFPTILIICSAVIGYLVLASAVFFMKRLRVKEYKYVSFSMIKTPRSMSVVLVILMLISMFSEDTSMYTLAVKNVAAVLAFIIAVNGLSVVDFLLKRRVKSGYRRFGIYIAVFILGYFLISIIFYMLLLIGMIDSTRNIRMFNRIGEDSEKNK